MPCDVCHKANQTREPFHSSEYKSKCLCELVHLDVWGPYKVSATGGFIFFLTIVDNFTRATRVYLMKSKYEVFACFHGFILFLENQINAKIKVVRSDNGTKFANYKIKK